MKSTKIILIYIKKFSTGIEILGNNNEAVVGGLWCGVEEEKTLLQIKPSLPA